MSATDWLDNRAGIMRTSRERLERRIGESLRKLGKERAAEGLSTFIRLHRDQAAKGLAEKLRSLPIIDGQPDIAALGDPALVAKQWAAELHLTPEEQLQHLLQYLEEMRTGVQSPSCPESA